MATADTWRRRTRLLQTALGVVLVAEVATVLHIESAALAGPLLVVGSLLAAALAWLALLTTRFAIQELEDAHRRAVEQSRSELETARRQVPRSTGPASALTALKAALAERPAAKLVLGSLAQATGKAPADSDSAKPDRAAPETDAGPDTKPAESVSEDDPESGSGETEAAS